MCNQTVRILQTNKLFSRILILKEVMNLWYRHERFNVLRCMTCIYATALHTLYLCCLYMGIITAYFDIQRSLAALNIHDINDELHIRDSFSTVLIFIIRPSRILCRLYINVKFKQFNSPTVFFYSSKTIL